MNTSRHNSPFLSTITKIIIILSILFLAGCASKTLIEAPGYIGTSCSYKDKSRIVESKLLYAGCVGGSWFLMTDKEFRNHISYSDNPQQLPGFIMRAPLTGYKPNEGSCVQVRREYSGFKDVEVDESILRIPVVDFWCQEAACTDEAIPYEINSCESGYGVYL